MKWPNRGGLLFFIFIFIWDPWGFFVYFRWMVIFIAVDMHLYHINLALLVYQSFELIFFLFHQTIHVCLHNCIGAGLSGLLDCINRKAARKTG
jgi:hypothetical protein